MFCYYINQALNLINCMFNNERKILQKYNLLSKAYTYYQQILSMCTLKIEFNIKNVY